MSPVRYELWKRGQPEGSVVREGCSFYQRCSPEMGKGEKEIS